MMSALFHFQQSLNKFFNNQQFFLKYEGGSQIGQIHPPTPPEKTTLKKPILIRVKQLISKQYLVLHLVLYLVLHHWRIY